MVKPTSRPRRPAPLPRSLRGTASLLAVAAILAAAGAWWFWPARLPPNLVLVTIDTLRADRVGAYGYARASTPVLDGLAREGVRFSRAQAAVPLTGPSHATILTGLYPPVHGVRDNVAFPLDPRHTTLAARLKARGYRTAAFVGAYPVAKDFGFGQGFDHFDEALHAGAAGEGAERPGNEVADAAVRWLEGERRAPFFAWVHFYDPHAPYEPPGAYAETYRDRPYDGEVAFADSQLGRVLEGLEAAGRGRDTVVAVLADHGEGLGDHGEATHSVLVYESTLHIPLILRGPDLPAGRVVDERVGTVDLVPTLLALLGVPRPEGLTGRDLSPSWRGGRLPREPLYAESLFARLNCGWSSLRTWTDGDFKLIAGADQELYDLARDPSETRNLASQEQARVLSLAGSLRAALGRMTPQGDAARPVALSPEQEERLRSLGYAGAARTASSLDEAGRPDPRARIRVFDRIQEVVLARGSAAAPALAELEVIASDDPGNLHAQLSLAQLANRHGALRLASWALERAVGLDPDRPSLRAFLGQVLRDRGRFEDSERHLRIALEQAPDERGRVSLAETLVARGETAEAASILRDVLAGSPARRDALLAMGRLLARSGRAQDAVAYLERAADGSDPEAWLALARVQLALGDAQQALGAAAEALRRNPGHPGALTALGEALWRSGDRAKARTAWREALAIRPRRADVWLELAQALETSGDAEAARRCRREAAALAAP